MSAEAVPKYQPLYKQIKSLILQKVIDGDWTPGMVLPSEQQLGVNFGVSQGTIRKALDELTAEKVFVRKQGKGTYVSQHSTHNSLFHFFHIVDEKGEKEVPESKIISINRSIASQVEMERLQLNPNDKVTRLKRVRYLKQEPVIVERISLPMKLFQNIGKEDTLPNTLYSLYETKYDVKVMRAIEQIKAVGIHKDDAEFLNIDPQAPVLEIDRTAIAIDGLPVEWRLSYVHTKGHSYLSKLF